MTPRSLRFHAVWDYYQFPDGSRAYGWGTEITDVERGRPLGALRVRRDANEVVAAIHNWCAGRGLVPGVAASINDEEFVVRANAR